MRREPIGLSLLDELCGGGLISAAVNTVYGAPGTGKTTFAITSVINLIKRCRNCDIVVIDTESGWSMSRVSKIAEYAGVSKNRLEALKVYTASTLGEQHRLITKVIPSDVREYGWNLKLLIVDSLVSFYHAQLLSTPPHLLASKARELQGRLSLQINNLLRLSHGYDAPILLVSWRRSGASRSFERRMRKSVLEAIKSGWEVEDIEAGLGSTTYPLIGGQHLTYMSKLILHLASIENNPSLKLICVEKALDVPSYRGCLLKISDRGIEEYTEKIEPVNKLIASIKVLDF